MITSRLQGILLGIRGYIDYVMNTDNDWPDPNVLSTIGHDLSCYWDPDALPRTHGYAPKPRSVDEQAKLMLGEGQTYDTALPQDWVDAVRHNFHVNPVGMFVWWYPQGSVMGQPFPLTDYAIELLAMIKEGT